MNQIRKTAYVQWLINSTYEHNSLSGDQRKMIANQLIADCKEQNPQAFEIVGAVGDKTFTQQTFLDAAVLVIQSK